MYKNAILMQITLDYIMKRRQTVTVEILIMQRLRDGYAKLIRISCIIYSLLLMIQFYF